MKCPKCGADSAVLSTRDHDGVMLRRRRKCFNEAHVFITYEVYSGDVQTKRLNQRPNGIKVAAQAWKRKDHVAKNPTASASKLAKDLNISEAAVRWIRKHHGLGPNGPSIIDDAKATMAENFLQPKP
jgi:hypothetical protein